MQTIKTLFTSIAISLLVASVFGCVVVDSANADERPNVLFIAMDDLNDWIGCLGGHP